MYVLANDIDMTGVTFMPIGSEDTSFVGAFNGNGYEMQNLTIDNSHDNYQGLFGYVGTGDQVMSVGVTGSIIGDYCNVGGIAGYILATDLGANGSRIVVYN